MIIQRAGIIKFARYLAIFCAITMGFFCIVATSEDDAEDAVEEAAAFDEDIEVASVTVTSGDPAPTSLHKNCELGISINGLATDAGVDTSDIKSIKLNSLSARYRNADITPDTGTFTCSATLSGDQNTTFPSIDVVEGNGDWIGATLSQNNLDAVNYYLDNRDAVFDICAVCDADVGNTIEDFTADIEVKMDVEITPDL